MVAEFHVKHGNEPADLVNESRGQNNGEDFSLEGAAACLKDRAQQLMRWSQYPRGLRAQLLVEEVGEALGAMADGDEAALLDALADLLYVTLGAAVTFDLPLEVAFREVHRSNMTKAAQADGSRRVLVKGPGYEPPRLAEVLAEYRGRVKKEPCANCGGSGGWIDGDKGQFVQCAVCKSPGMNYGGEA